MYAFVSYLDVTHWTASSGFRRETPDRTVWIVVKQNQPHTQKAAYGSGRGLCPGAGSRNRPCVYAKTGVCGPRRGRKSNSRSETRSAAIPGSADMGRPPLLFSLPCRRSDTCQRARSRRPTATQLQPNGLERVASAWYGPDSVFRKVPAYRDYSLHSGTA